MLSDALFALWFLLPAGCANIAPVFAAVAPYLKRWQAPVDGGRTYKGQKIFGPHKTWRGIISGVLVSALVFWLQKEAMLHYDWLRTMNDYVDYSKLPLVLGPLLGAGALGGDLIKSFIKRRRNIPSGQKWIPFDQLDYVIGATLMTLPFVVLDIQIYAWMLALWFIIHLIVSYAGYLLGLKKYPI